MLIHLGFFCSNKYIEIDLKVQHTDEDPIYVDHYDAEALHEIFHTQHQRTEHTINKMLKKLFQIHKNY